MKRIVALICVLTLVFTFCACSKKVNPADFDEGPDIDAGIESQYSEVEEGNPYAQSEIGISTASKNIMLVFGNYMSDLKCYVKYEYVKDSTHDGNPCYLYSRMISKTLDGEYKHHDYIAVYKDGSMMMIV